GTCDFAVILLAVGQDLDGLTTLPLWEDDLVLVCSPSSPWASLPLADLDVHQMPFVSTPRNMPRRELEESLLRRQGFEQRRVVIELGH
ncbi:LysR family transcriptional regulator substrate-binding protein, partial [Pseudomonas putida]|uniref:LysR family transcriptional regulator substrate-binding protein n=2 Tax=Pseudomonas TaxID=286 RepID=UPI0035235CA4